MRNTIIDAEADCLRMNRGKIQRRKTKTVLQWQLISNVSILPFIPNLLSTDDIKNFFLNFKIYY